MPTFMIFQKGQKIDTVTGAVPAKITVRARPRPVLYACCRLIELFCMRPLQAALKELPSKIPGLAEPTPAAA